MTAGVLAAGAASAANATRVFYADFEGLNGGASASNYSTLPGLTFLSGAVDLVHDGDNGVQCPSSPEGGGNSCIDLEGANGTYGRLQSAVAYEVHAGDTVTLSFSASGNQRQEPDFLVGDDFFAGFRWAPTVIDLSELHTSGWSLAFLDPLPTIGIAINGALGTRSFGLYSMSFVAPQDLMVSFRIGGGRGGAPGLPADDLGILIDEIALDITSPGGVPEPSTWAMMLLGFGGLGAALRRRRAAYA